MQPCLRDGPIALDGCGRDSKGLRRLVDVETGKEFQLDHAAEALVERMVGHTYACSGTFTVRLTVTDAANQTDTEAQSVTVTTGGAPCTNCQALRMGHRRAIGKLHVPKCATQVTPAVLLLPPARPELIKLSACHVCGGLAAEQWFLHQQRSR